MIASSWGRATLRPLILLTLWQIKNTLLHALHSPKKLAPLLLMAAYGIFVWVTLIHNPQAYQHNGEITAALRAHRALFHTGVFLGLVLFCTGATERGFAGGSLRFVPADVDYLFSAPFPRRLVLLFKIGMPVLTTALFTVALAVYSMRHFGSTSPLPTWAVMVAFGACLGAYGNLAVAIELVFGLGRWPWGRRAIYAVLLLTIAYVGLTCWHSGLAGLARISQRGVLPIAFFPCRLASDVGTAALDGGRDLAAIWGLLGIYGLTLTLLFSRHENFYEPALSGAERVWQSLQAQKENPWHGLRAGKSRGANAPPYALRPFGRGVGALFWAHLAAAAKAPFANFVLPTLTGLVLVALFWRSRSEDYDLGVALFTFYYFAATTVFSGLFFFKRALQRQVLIRPLPLPARGAVLAEIGPRTLLAAPFYVVAAAGLLLAHGSEAALPAITLLGWPLVGLCLNLLQYTLALWYPSAEDKVQGIITQIIQLVLVLVLMVLLASLLAIPVHLGAPNWLSLLIFAGGTLWTAGFLLALASGAYAGYQPEGGPITIDRPLVRRYLRPAFVVAALGLIAGTVASRISQARNQPPAAPRTVLARWGDLAVVVQETGTLAPVDKVDVRSKVAGRILTLPIQEGQFVRQGQLIATIDRTLLDPQLTTARAQLDQAQAHLQQTQDAYQLQRTQTRMAVAQAKAALATAQAQLAAAAAGPRPPEVAQQQQAVDRARIADDDARRTLSRKQALLAKGFIAQADADAAQVAADTADSTLAAAGQSLALTLAGPRPQDVSAARAQAGAARVALMAARANAPQDAVSASNVVQARASVQQAAGALSQLLVSLRDTRILAPSSGLVLKRYKQVGEIVQSATTGFSDTESLLVTLGGRLEVEVGVNEVDVGKVRVGARASVSVDAVPGLGLGGVVTAISPASTNAFPDTSGGGGGSGTGGISKFLVKVGLAGSDSRLRPGMSAGVTMVSAVHRHVVVVPVEAVAFAGDQGDVTLWTALGQRRTRHVRLGLRNDTDVEVRQGLRPGDKVIVPKLTGTRRTISITGD